MNGLRTKQFLSAANISFVAVKKDAVAVLVGVLDN